MSDLVTTFDLSRSVNDTILAVPQTLPVFAALGMDTCWRGGMPLAAAAEAAGVSVRELLAALEVLMQNAASASSAGAGTD